MLKLGRTFIFKTSTIANKIFKRLNNKFLLLNLHKNVDTWHHFYF